jgi:hypothetical protein
MENMTEMGIKAGERIRIKRECNVSERHYTKNEKTGLWDNPSWSKIIRIPLTFEGVVKEVNKWEIWLTDCRIIDPSHLNINDPSPWHVRYEFGVSNDIPFPLNDSVVV